MQTAWRRAQFASYFNGDGLGRRVEEPAPAASERTLDDLKREHGMEFGARIAQPRGEINEQSPVRNYVRDLVLGFNDGLVSVFAVTAGVAGAAFATDQILIAGVAAAFAGAMSMAAGEYISTKSQAQFYASERRREEEHLRRWPELEKQELREDLEQKGLHGPVLEEAVAAISSDRERFLDYMMREEFGVGKESGRSPVKAALFVIFAFLFGSLFPLMPYAAAPGSLGVLLSTIFSLAGLFLAGVIRARASRLPPIPAGAEMMLVGVVAALITFGIGRLFGWAV